MKVVENEQWAVGSEIPSFLLPLSNYFSMSKNDAQSTQSTSKTVSGGLATICLLAFFLWCGYMFLQWGHGEIEEGGSQELQYLAMFLGIIGVIFLILNRTQPPSPDN